MKKLGRRAFIQNSAKALGVLGAVGVSLESVSGAAEPGQQASKADPALVRRYLGEMASKGSRYWSVPQEDGEFLHFLVKAVKARNVLEVGTSHGYSALWMGLALEETGGRLISIEIDRERHELARRHVSEAGLSHKVTLVIGDAHKEIPKIDGLFDLVFLDADKEGQMDYFRKLYPKKLVPGGILAVHNAIHQAGTMKDYLDMIRKHADFDTITLSLTMEDGFCLSRRH